MEQRLSILTLGMDDLVAMRDFYVEKFGWTPVAENKDIVFFKLNGVLLSFFEKGALAQDARVEPASVGSKQFSLAHNVETEEEVDELFAILESRGVKMVKRPRRRSSARTGGTWLISRATCGTQPATPTSSLMNGATSSRTRTSNT